MALFCFVGSHGLVDLDGLVLAVETDVAGLHLLEDGGGGPHEGPLDVLLVLGGGLDVEHVVVAGQFEGLLLGHHPFLHQVALVADQHQDHVFVAVILDVLDPPCHVAEGFLAGDVEDYEGGGR